MFGCGVQTHVLSGCAGCASTVQGLHKNPHCGFLEFVCGWRRVVAPHIQALLGLHPGAGAVSRTCQESPGGNCNARLVQSACQTMNTRSLGARSPSPTVSMAHKVRCCGSSQSKTPRHSPNDPATPHQATAMWRGLTPYRSAIRDDAKPAIRGARHSSPR